MEESEKNSCYLNEYALMDILLDIAISMARIPESLCNWKKKMR